MLWRWRTRLMKALLPVAVALLLLYVSDQLLTGDRGLVTWRLLHQQVDALADENAELQGQVAKLTADVARLKPQGKTPPDPDYVDELIRRSLPLVRKGETVIFLPSESRPAAN